MDVTGLLARSFYGGVLVLVVLFVRAAALNRLPKRTFPILWCVALVRLLLPFSLPSGFSIYTFLPLQTAPALLEDTARESAEMDAADGFPTLSPARNRIHTGKQAQMPSASGNNALPIPLLLWSVGAAGLGLFFTLAYLHGLRVFGEAVPVKDGRILQWLESRRLGRFISVRQSERIAAPLTYGILRPVILLPQGLPWGEGPEPEYILQHEYVHICRHDGAVKLAMAAALCMHWFNPLVWLMACLLNRDIELACDEGVLRRFGEQSRAGYAMTLIGMEVKKRNLLPLSNGFSKNATEERIKLIMKYKKATYVTGIVSLLLILCVVLVFATSPKPANAAENPQLPSGYPKGMDRTDVPLDPPEGIPMDGMDGMDNTDAADAAPLDTASAELYRGSGYRILIPREGWQLYAPDAWMSTADDRVQVWVADFSKGTWEQAVSGLENSGYSSGEEENELRMESDGRLFFAQMHRSDCSIMCVFYTYPAKNTEQAELLRAIAASFTMDSGEEEEALSEDGRQIRQTALAFWKAWLAGNTEAMGQYLSGDFAWEPEVFPDGIDGHVAEEASIQAVKGLDAEGAGAGGTCEIWLEFLPAAGAESLEYLTLEFIREPGGWKILSYGLEL